MLFEHLLIEKYRSCKCIFNIYYWSFDNKCWYDSICKVWWYFNTLVNYARQSRHTEPGAKYLR